MTSSDILQIQIDICNRLARQRQAIFHASHTWTERVSTGWCLPDVQAEDVIVLCEEVQIPLIVRPCSSEANTVRLIGLALSGCELVW